MSKNGKSSTSTSSVSIPPEVLARYNSVNTRAEETGNIPFQPYGGEFVAPLSQTQQAGVANINQAAGMAQPYYQGATESLLGGASQAQPYYQAATQQVGGSLAAAAPLQQASMINQLAGQQAGQQALASGTAQSQPVYGTALTGLGNIAGVTSPLQAQSSQNILGAMSTATPMAHQAIANIMGAQGQAQPYMGAAGQALGAAASATQPIQQEAYRGIGAAQAAGSPYQELATQYGLAGARQLTPEGLSVDRYMSPYIQSVAEPTMRALRQQQQMEQQSILGDQIKGGAFGGDRGRIAQAVLAQQQGLATAKAMGDIYQQGYGQAVSTAQQQQGLQLAAEQANRLAQQQAAQQMLGIGQQGFGQNLSAAQQRAALGQQLFGQGLGMAQQQAALGQQAFNQAAQTSQQQAALSQLQYGQQMGAAQAQQTLAQQLASQGLGTAQAQAGIGQQLFGQGAQAAQQLYGMGAGTAAQQAALAQQQYAQQMGAAQQLQGLGQGLYGMGAGVSQGLTGIGGAAQQAALQGGQAQLGAGQLEQQTRQAENQAYYNQFLQQQGYPYQVAQFLANVAMGTGALSGSTTTTTQPSSFFSDKRLKDDIEPIGKTYDGQDIVRYRYKGEPATRIGLVAQDVEKKHPEAVGLAGGYKTVDYDKATDAAAARAPKAYGGGLNPWGDASAYGGSVFREDAGRGYAVGGAPGGDDILAQINALVNSHQGMFPYGKAGMYGSGMGKAGPYGSTLMQAANRQLMRADPVRQPPPYDVRQAMRDVQDIQKMPETISKSYQGIKGGLLGSPESTRQITSGGQTVTQTTGPSGGLLGHGGNLQWEGSWGAQLADALGLAHGGAARGNYAMGGMPYSQAENEYVPEDISAPVKPQGLQPAKPAAPGRTTGDDIMTMIKLASMASGMGFSSGGLVPRQGYQQGGGPEIPEEYRSIVEEVARERGVPPHVLGAVLRHESAFNPEARGQAGEIGLGQILPSTARRPGFGLNPVGEEDLRDPRRNIDFSASYIAARNPNVDWSNPVAAARALAANYNAGGDPDYAAKVIRYFPGVTEDQIAEVRARAPENRPVASDDLARLAGQQRPQRGLVKMERPEPDWMQRNQQYFVPLLAGLAGMASSPSRYLGSAILQGLGTAAETYGGMQARFEEQQRAREQTGIQAQQAATAERRVDVEESLRNLQLLQRFESMYERRLGADNRVFYLDKATGQQISLEEYNRRYRQMLGSLAGGASGVGAVSASRAPGAPEAPVAGRPGEAPAPGAAPAEQPAAPPAEGATEGRREAPAVPATQPQTPPPAPGQRAEPASPYASSTAQRRLEGFDYSVLRNEDNPQWIDEQIRAKRARIAALRTEGTQQALNEIPGLESEVKDYQQRVDRIIGGEIVPRNQDNTLNEQFQRLAVERRQDAKFVESLAESRTNQYNRANAFVSTEYPVARGLIDQLTQIYQNVQTNRGSDVLAQIAGLGSQLPWLGPIIQEYTGALQAAVDAGNKTAIEQAFSKIAESGAQRAPGTALREALLTVAQPGMSPDARYIVITNTLANLERENKQYRDWLNAGMPEPAAYNARWTASGDNDLSVFQRQAVARTPRFAGMTEGARPLIRGGEPAAAPAAPRRVATEADINATLAANPGMTREQVIQRARSMGYEVGGE